MQQVGKQSCAQEEEEKVKSTQKEASKSENESNLEERCNFESALSTNYSSEINTSH